MTRGSGVQLRPLNWQVTDITELLVCFTLTWDSSPFPHFISDLAEARSLLSLAVAHVVPLICLLPMDDMS